MEFLIVGVFVLIFIREGFFYIFFILRFEYLFIYKGEVVFFGGKKEDDDEDIVVIVLREVYEEVGLFLEIV